MNWLITHKPSYDTDFIGLPKDLQERATAANHELAENPNTLRGNTIKPLQGWQNVWRYRLGNHRLVYAVAPDSRVVQLLAIGPRDSIYSRFSYDGWEAPDANITFDARLAEELSPRREAPPEWTQHPEWIRPEQEKQPLPRRLTPGWLKKLLVPLEYHPELSHCRTEDDLEQAEIPYEVFARIVDALWPPPAERLAGQPDQVLFKPEDLEAYAEGTLRGFLLHLDENQRRFTDWALAGPTLVKGGPGSGKSTVALYRARAVIEHALADTETIPEVLFTTYTNALTSFSESLLQQLLGDTLGLELGQPLPRAVRVTTVDKMVMWIARSTGQPFDLAEAEQCLEALHYARSELRPRQLGDLNKLLVSNAVQNLRDDYLLEEFDWIIEGQDCRTEADYLISNRAGRAIPFNKQTRSAVWQLYTAYREYLRRYGRLTWGLLRQMALDEVTSGGFSRRWDYVIVDEAQDLTPAAIALCVELCQDPSGLFLTADANQSLYNRGFRWQQVHDQLKVVGRTRILRRNYRSTKEIAHAAAELLSTDGGDGEDRTDAEALQQEYVHTGPPPAIYAAGSADDQAGWLAKQLHHAARELRLPLSAAAVLVPSNSLGRALAERIQEHGLPARFMPSQNVNLTERCIKVMTLHAAKGLEFPIIAVAHVEADRLPKPIESSDEKDLQEHLDHQRRIFYVGCTRAMRYLFVTHDRWLPSPFLDYLSDYRWQKLGN
jgi:superfamily I DNA/RNA helicase/mRNA-degrading endonuclease RelE of RelBE toxin-antitoxin system